MSWFLKTIALLYVCEMHALMLARINVSFHFLNHSGLGHYGSFPSFAFANYVSSLLGYSSCFDSSLLFCKFTSWFILSCLMSLMFYKALNPESCYYLEISFISSYCNCFCCSFFNGSSSYFCHPSSSSSSSWSLPVTC